MMTKQIWEEFHEKLLGFIAKRTGDLDIAKDILQEVFVKIHQKIDTLKDRQKITSWIYRLTRNTIIDHYRKKREYTSGLLPGHDLPEEIDTLPEEIDAHNADFARCVEPFMRRLAYKDRDILQNVFFERVSQKAYAERRQISYSAAKSRLQRAKQKLKAVFIDCCNVQSDTYGGIISYSKNTR